MAVAVVELRERSRIPGRHSLDAATVAVELVHGRPLFQGTCTSTTLRIRDRTNGLSDGGGRNLLGCQSTLPHNWLPNPDDSEGGPSGRSWLLPRARPPAASHSAPGHTQGHLADPRA